MSRFGDYNGDSDQWTAVLSAFAGVSATVFVLLQLRHMDKHDEFDNRGSEWNLMQRAVTRTINEQNRTLCP